MSFSQGQALDSGWQGSSMQLQNVLESIQRKGVTLWIVEGQLHYKAPKGALTSEEIATLRASKNEIADLLRPSGRHGESGLERGSYVLSAPLSCSQWAHWNLYHLSERHSIRQLASVTRLRGELSIGTLQQALIEVGRHHEALRTRIAVVQGIPRQEVLPSREIDFGIDDLRSSPSGSREQAAHSLIQSYISTPVDLAKDPLVGVRLIRMLDTEHVLIIAMEHMVGDAFSLNILFRDLFSAYEQLRQGDRVTLPKVAVQCRDYAIWQESSLESRLRKHGDYWNDRLQSLGTIRFPSQKDETQAPTPGWSYIPVQIDGELKAELLQWCRFHRTTLPMSFFTAYTALVLRWCGSSEVTLQYQTNGRGVPGVENTIGYFAAAVYPRVRLKEEDTFVDLLQNVTDEYCKAYQHADYSYIEARNPRPACARAAGFNWVPQVPAGGGSRLGEAEEGLSFSPVEFEHPMLATLERDNDPILLLYDMGDRVIGGVHFPLSRFSSRAMEQFTGLFFEVIRLMLRDARHPVAESELSIRRFADTL